MATIVGGIDERLRPYIRIEPENAADGLLALLDTGFNGELFIDEADADLLGFALREGYSKATLAGGVVHNIRRGSGKIIWLGQLRRVEVLAAVTTGTRQHRPPDDPIALVGTKLLSPHLLLMDLAKRSIEIEAQD